MFGIYEASERGLMIGSIQIEQSSNLISIRLIQNNLTIK
jgi:hypothetical protein